jgi:hypothetical protein
MLFMPQMYGWKSKRQMEASLMVRISFDRSLACAFARKDFVGATWSAAVPFVNVPLAFADDVASVVDGRRLTPVCESRLSAAAAAAACCWAAAVDVYRGMILMAT